MILFIALAINYSLSFSILKMALIIFLGLSCQLLCEKFFLNKVHKFWWKSATISCLSLALLMRFESYFVLSMATIITITSKFILRTKIFGHIFNPTNLAITVSLLLFSDCWLDYGHWGRGNTLALIPIALGSLYLKDFRIWSTTAIYLSLHLIIFGIRHYWLGEPWAIFMHQNFNAAFYIFAFFMISDPKTVPQHIYGKVLFCFLVVMGTYFWEAILYNKTGAIFSLTFTSCFSPLINKVFNQEKYQWENLPA